MGDAGAPEPSEPRIEILHERRQRPRARVPVPGVAVFGLVSGEGDVSALAELLRALPSSLPAALLLVQHLPAERFEDFVAWLKRRTRLEVRPALDGAYVLTGRVYVAPPDLHLALRPSGRLRLSDGPPERGLRPSGDVLLRSIALSCSARGAAVLFEDTCDDGVAGAAAVRAVGGRALLRASSRGRVLGLPRVRDGRLGPLEVLEPHALAARVLALAAASADSATALDPRP